LQEKNHFFPAENSPFDRHQRLFAVLIVLFFSLSLCIKRVKKQDWDLN